MWPAGGSSSGTPLQITWKSFWVRVRGLEPLRHLAGDALPAFHFPKELYSEGKTVPSFVPYLNQMQSQMVADGRESKSSLLAREINTIANHRTPSYSSWDGLLISGLQVRVL